MVICPETTHERPYETGFSSPGGVPARAAEIKVEAMALMGEMLKGTEKNPGAKGTGSNQHKKVVRSPDGTAPLTYAQAGIGKKEASDTQVLATIKEEEPELFEQVKAGKKRVSHARAELKREEKREGGRPGTTGF